MKRRSFYRFDREDVVKAVQDVAGTEPQVFECECGCETVIAYAMGSAPHRRDVPVLWVLPQLSAGPSMTVTGLETVAETRQLLDRMEARMDDTVMVRKIRPVLLNAWLKVAN